MKKTLALVGQQGVGKTTLANFLKEKGVVTVFVEDIKDITEGHQKEQNEQAQTKKIIERIRSVDADTVVIDDIKKISQIKELKKNFSVRVLAITCDDKIRLERLLAKKPSLAEKRNILLDEKKTYDIFKLVNQADMKIDNSGGMKELYETANRVFRSLLSDS